MSYVDLYQDIGCRSTLFRRFSDSSYRSSPQTGSLLERQRLQECLAETLTLETCSDVYSHSFNEMVGPLFGPERRHSLLDVRVGISGFDGIAVEEEKTW